MNRATPSGSALMVLGVSLGTASAVAASLDQPMQPLPRNASPAVLLSVPGTDAETLAGRPRPPSDFQPNVMPGSSSAAASVPPPDLLGEGLAATSSAVGSATTVPVARPVTR